MILHEGIEKAVRDFGADVLLEERLLGVLADYRALQPEAVRVILRAMVREGLNTTLHTKYTRGDSDGADYLCALTVRVASLGFDTQFARYVVMSIGRALGWTAEEPVPPEFIFHAELEARKAAEARAKAEARAREIAEARAEAAKAAQPPQTRLLTLSACGVDFALCCLPGGRFTMGATPDQGLHAGYDERPAVEVMLSPFAIGVLPVTQALWQAVTGGNPSHFAGADRPVERVSWYECRDFLGKLGAITGRALRLPTEAEWEYAARACGCIPQTLYAGTDNASLCAWSRETSGGETNPVGLLVPNAVGLRDMCGNVGEWCQDWYFSSYASGQVRVDPAGPASGIARVVRGGSYADKATACRVARRSSLSPDYRSRQTGLRVAMSLNHNPSGDQENDSTELLP